MMQDQCIMQDTADIAKLNSPLKKESLNIPNSILRCPPMENSYEKLSPSPSLGPKTQVRGISTVSIYRTMVTIPVCMPFIFLLSTCWSPNLSAALVVNKILTEEDADEILEELIPAQNESYMLGIKLKLPLYQLDSIQDQFTNSRERLLQTMIAFLRQESKPTWSVIVAALRSLAVNQQALANRVEKAHVHEPRDTCAPLETSGE